MRLNSLTASRYGKFDGKLIDLPRMPEFDLHVVFGPNEAGKSTIRGALTDLIYGIPERCTMGYLQPGTPLVLGGHLEHDGADLKLQRFKKRKNPITDMAGTAISDAIFAKFVGPTEREFFERMFCLDYKRLVRGGTEILDAKDEVARMIFQAASGLDSIKSLRDDLAAEADSLFTGRKSDRAYNTADTALGEAEQALKQALVRAKAWNDAQAALATASTALGEGRQGYNTLETRRTALERARRVAPHLQNLKQLAADLEALADAVLLPEGAGEQLRDAERDLAVAQKSVGTENDRQQAAAAEMAAAKVDPVAVEQRSAITALAELRAAVQNHPGDIIKRREEAERLEKKALASAAALKLTAGDVGTLAKSLPAPAARTALAALSQDYQGIKSRVEAANTAQEEAQGRRDKASKTLDDVPAGADPAAIGHAADAARALGNVEDQRSQIQRRSSAAQQALGDVMRKLAPWAGSIDELRAMVLPTSEEGEAALRRFRTLEMDVQAQKARLRELELDRDEANAAAQEALATGSAVPPEQLDAARAARDSAWTAIKCGSTTVGAGAEGLEGATRAADEVADARFDGAEAAHALTTVRGTAEKAARAVTRQAKLVGETAADLADQEKDWVDALTTAGAPQQTLPRACAWLTSRDDALKAGSALDLVTGELDVLDKAVSGAAGGLRDALAGAEIALPKPDTLRSLISTADAYVTKQRNDVAARDAAGKAVRAADTDIELAKGRRETADKALADWAQSWGKALAAVGLPLDSTAAGAYQALDAFNLIAADLMKARELRDARIQPMQDDLDGFKTVALALAASLAMPDGLEPDAISKQASARLTAADAAATAQADASKRHRDATGHLDAGNDTIRDAKASLAPLLSAIKSESLEDLRTAIENSSRKRLLQRQVDEARAKVVESAGGLPLEDAAAEVEAVDITRVESAISALTDQQKVLQETRERLTLEERTAAVLVGTMNGGTAAANAEGRRQEALAAMAIAARRYIRVKVAQRVLTWSIDRYREERQDPLLKLAGSKFGALTNGSFDTLSVDYENDTPVIKGQRGGTGALVGVEDMSEGTRDQLYLALRLAAVEQHLERAHALPFVADDLFINFDENRVECGLRQMADLAKHTQVIYLTHHQHVADCASATFGAGVNIIRL